MFDVALGLIVFAVVLFIARAVRQTRGQIDGRLRGTDPYGRDDIARDPASRIREQADRVECSRCGGPSFMLLGTETRYQCESCHFTFDGPPHMTAPQPELRSRLGRR